MQGKTVDHPSQSGDEQAINNQALKDQNQSARSEKLRQSYLGAMGIQTWYPRCQLSNALPARPFDWIKEDAEVFAASEAGTATPASHVAPPQQKPQTDYSRTKPADILGQFMASATPAVQEAKPIEEVTPEPVKQLSGSVSKFRLIILPVSDECLIVAEMPHSGLNQFSRYHQRLLKDILRALKLSSNNTSPFREFVWPMSENRGLLSQLNQDDYAAADAVCAYLSNQYGLSRRKFVLLLGQSAARFVLDPEKSFEQLRGIQQGTHTNQWFAVTHGLNELMKQPILKREAWQDLSPLLPITLSKTLPTSMASD